MTRFSSTKTLGNSSAAGGDPLSRLLSYLALAVPILAWGVSFPSIKAALTEFGPMTLAFGRFVIAGLVLGLFQAASRNRQPMSRSHWGALALSVLFGITLYFLFENNGVKLIPASAASLIIAGIPVLTLLAESLFSRRKLGVVGGVSVAVSFVGAALLVGLPEGGEVWGYVLMFGAALTWVAYFYCIGPLQDHYPNLQITAWQMILGAVSLAPFAAAELPQWQWPSAAAWGHLAFQGLVCSAASYWLYNYALDRLGMRIASLGLNLIPVVTAVASYLFLGELLGPWQWAGGALVLAAVVAVGLSDSARKPETAPRDPGHG